MRETISFIILSILMLPGLAWAQTATVTGRVTDAEGEALPGVNIYIPELTKGAASDAQGQYRITEIPPGTYTLRASFIGFEDFEQPLDLTAGGTHEVNITLQAATMGLDEVVVTGVAASTPKANLSFTVETIDAADLEVPSTNVGSALQGKIAGIDISGASGAPGSNPDIQLRGAKTIFGSGNPLVIVDGILTEGSLNDINAEDIRSIEVVKGAAASSLYGSRAANGVINIITKRGGGLRAGETRVTVRTEAGRNFMGYVPDKTTATNFLVEDGAVLYGQSDPDGIYDNPYPNLTDPVGQFFDPGLFLTNYVSFQGNAGGGNTSLYASLQHTQETGVVSLTDGQGRLNLRANLDHSFSDRFALSTSNFYSNSSIDHRADGIWDMFYYADPDVDFLAPNEEDGSPYNVDPNRLGMHENPLYNIANRVSDEDRYRFMGHYQLAYDPAPFLNLKLAYGLDRLQSGSTGITPKGKLLVDRTPDVGSIFKSESTTFAQTLQGDALLQRSFGDLDARLNLQYLLESNEYDYQSASGRVLAIKGLDIDNLDLASEDLNIGSYSTEVIANNYTSALYLDYQDKYIVDALVRRDGVSLFGSNVRWQTFYRLAGAWRVTHDVAIPSVQDLKLRASYGTAGLRPPFEARYEVVGLADGSVLSPITLGNEDLRPSISKELEVGLDAVLLNRLTFTANYARARNIDQILNVPVSAATGFASQWQNAGTLEATTLEFSLGTQLLRTDNVNWDVNLTWDRTRQEVVELERSGYAIVSGGIFRIAEGEEFGTLYGHKWATSLDEVMNQVPEGASVEDYFAVNNEGYVVRRSEIGTTNEVPIKIRDEQGNVLTTVIGNVNPDFTLNLGSSLDIRRLKLYMLWSWQQGGDMYNHMRRYMMVHNVGQELDQSDKPWNERKSARYYNELTNWNNSHFVEDATFLKLREVSLSYTLENARLNNLLGIQNVRLSAIGRNLLTFTRYSGFDPEAGHSEEGLDATVLKFDLSSYPIYRTFTGSIAFTF